MVYKRGKRPSFYFEAKLRVGHKQLCTDTSDRKTAQRVEFAWASLADQRAWDLLEPIVAGLEKPKAQRTHTIGRLLDLWTETKQDVAEMRRRWADVDVEPLVQAWADVYRTQVSSDSAAHALVHVRFFFPEGSPRLASTVTPDWITATLATYPGKRNTLRKVYSSLSVFLASISGTGRPFAVNPMATVERPKEQKSPIRFYELDVVERIVEWQPTAQRKALFALLYGSSVDLTPCLALHRNDFNPATKEFRGIGTKAHTRDRVLRVADWAWPTVWAYIKSMTPQTALFEGVTRYGASFWHRQTITQGMWEPTGRADGGTGGGARLVKAALKLSPAYPLQCARDHWAVRAARAGTPIAVIQQQLGHSSPLLTLSKYGRFLPSASDREKWERAATDYETQRREAK